jgi:hypothetical protein
VLACPSGGAPTRRQQRLENSLTRCVNAVSAFLACVESGGGDGSFLVAGASLEEVAIGAGGNTLDLPERIVDQRRKQLLARLGERFDRSGVPVACRHDTPCEASNEPSPAAAEAPAVKRLAESFLGKRLLEPCRSHRRDDRPEAGRTARVCFAWIRSRVVKLDLRALDELHAPLATHACDELLELVAGPRTDLFCPPDGGPPTLNAPVLLANIHDGDFVLSAHTEAELQATFDAGALVLWHDERTWAKLALELSPEGRPTVVTVVTRDRSDDCNSVVLDQPRAHLRTARIDDAFSFHLHAAGRWHLIRHFFLGNVSVRAGFLAQSPTGEGCTVRFREARVDSRRLDDIRDGS